MTLHICICITEIYAGVISNEGMGNPAYLSYHLSKSQDGCVYTHLLKDEERGVFHHLTQSDTNKPKKDNMSRHKRQISEIMAEQTWQKEILRGN